jgi:cytochrome c-type biogenesis protein CcmH/NrfG
MLTALKDELPDKDNVWVALASMYLKSGRKTETMNALRKAIELNPANKRQLQRNTNFQSIYEDPEFKRIIGN